MVSQLAPRLAQTPTRPTLRVIPGGRQPALRGPRNDGFHPREREKVALRTHVFTGERELRGVAVRLDENAVEVFGVNRGLEIGETVLIRMDLIRGERPVWMPACPHLVSPEKTLLWFDQADREDVARINSLLGDIRAGRARRDGLYAYFHAPRSQGLGRVCVLPPG
jgi:hypothetical protein